VLLDKTMEIMKPKEIAIATKREEGATRLLLRKMLDDGQVASPKYGGYCSIKHSTNTSNSCDESRSSGATNCYRPPVTLGNTSNSCSESPDVPPSEELLLDEELLTPGNTLIGHPGGLRDKSYQSYCSDTDQNLWGVAPDMADLFGTVDVTPIDDEPPADMVLTPHDPTADISPAQHRAELTCRVHKVATVVRPKSLADTQKVSRTKAAGPTKAPWLFGNWKMTSSSPSDAPPPRDEDFAGARAGRRQRRGGVLMNATAILQTIRERGGQVTLEGDNIRVRKTRGVLTDELRQAIRAEKAAILRMLAAEQQRAQMPLQSDNLVAVKVWSEVLREALWVLADDVPLDPYLAHGKVYMHHEVRVLLEQGRGVKAGAPLDTEMEG
jgi:hypothetical protein